MSPHDPARPSSDIAFTPSVKAAQAERGSRESYARMETGEGWPTEVTPDLAAFLGELDMFYLATANAEGQPYVQYRGGSPGFLRVVDERTLAFADFGGNRQYISVGNLAENPQAFLFLMDYAGKRRVKLWGRARVVEDDAELLEELHDADYPARPERAIVFELEAWNANCPQHIHRRYPEAAVRAHVGELEARIRELEEELERVRAGRA